MSATLKNISVSRQDLVENIEQDDRTDREMSPVIDMEDGDSSLRGSTHSGTDDILSTVSDDVTAISLERVSAMKQCRLPSIEILVALYFMSYTMCQPLSQEYIHHDLMKQFETNESHSRRFQNHSACILNSSSSLSKDITDIEQKTAEWSMILDASYLIPASVSTIMLGAFSDKRGRKPVMLCCMLGSLLKVLVYLITIASDGPIFCLVIGTALEGGLGGTNTMLSTVFAYVADITVAERRSMRIVLIDVSIGCGTALAQALIGILVSRIGYLYPFILIFCMLLLTFAYTLLFVKETVHPDVTAPICKLDHFKSISNLMKENPNRKQLIIGLVLLTLISLSQYNINNRLTLYLSDAPLCWIPQNVGYFLFFSILIRQFGTLVSSKCLRQYVGDSGLAMAGILSAIGFDVMMSGAVKTAVVYSGKSPS